MDYLAPYSWPPSNVESKFCASHGMDLKPNAIVAGYFHNFYATISTSHHHGDRSPLQIKVFIDGLVYSSSLAACRVVPMQ